MQLSGLKPCPNSPCLFYGHPIPGNTPLYLEVYVDYFIYFSPDDTVEIHFETTMQAQLRVDFFRRVEWFLGTYYDWSQEDGHASVHLSQEAYSRQLISVHQMSSATPADTPYHTGHTINEIPKTDMPTLKQDIVTSKYQSLVGSLLWLAYDTHPDLCISTSRLAQYNKQPSSRHYDVARYVFEYILGTIDHGLRLTHKPNTTLVNFIGFVPPPNTTFSDANWGPQNSSVPTASQPAIHTDINYTRSLYGHGTYRYGGPIYWSVFHESRTSRSSCEAEIKSADEATRVTQYLRHILNDLEMHDTNTAAPVFNDNQGCIDWSKATSIKNLRHFNIRENAVREAVQHQEIDLKHHPGVRNLAGLFTK
jgi:hypothetical protein